MRVQLAEVGTTLAKAVLPQLARYSTALVQLQKDTNFIGRATQIGADGLKEFAVAAFGGYTALSIMAQSIGVASSALSELWVRQVRVAIGAVNEAYRELDVEAAMAPDGQFPVLTPEECRALVDALGPIEPVVMKPLLAGCDPALGWSSLELFATEVLPRLHG